MTLALGLSCSAPSEPANELVVAIENAPIHLDPRIATDQASARVFEVAVSGLVTKDTADNMLPDLAESWQILDDGARYRFHLRPNVRFHDGRPFTSEDVAWTFNTMLTGEVISPKRGAFPLLESVEAVDPLTVDFVLASPYGVLLPDLTSYTGIVPNGMSPEEMNRNPIGTGPYRVVDRRPDRVVLEAFEDYWGEPPAIPRLVIREVPDATVRALELRKGSVHLVVNGLTPDVIQSFRDDDALRVVENPGANYSYIGINLEDPLLSDVRVRRAMALAIDRPRIVKTLWQGLGVATETVIRPGHWARHNQLEPIPFDPAAARALLDEAGYPDPDGDGPEPRFKITYKVSTDEIALLQAQVIQSMLAAVGIAIEIRSYEFATFYSDVKQGNFQIFSLTWTGIVDPHFLNLILHSNSIPPDGANRGRYRNPEFDRLLDLGASLIGHQERLPMYLRAQEIFARDLPYISLFIKVNVAVMAAELEGYRNYSNGQLYSIKNMRWVRDSPGAGGE